MDFLHYMIFEVKNYPLYSSCTCVVSQRSKFRLHTCMYIWPTVCAPAVGCTAFINQLCIRGIYICSAHVLTVQYRHTESHLSGFLGKVTKTTWYPGELQPPLDHAATRSVHTSVGSFHHSDPHFSLCHTRHAHTACAQVLALSSPLISSQIRRSHSHGLHPRLLQASKSRVSVWLRDRECGRRTYAFLLVHYFLLWHIVCTCKHYRRLILIA